MVCVFFSFLFFPPQNAAYYSKVRNKMKEGENTQQADLQQHKNAFTEINRDTAVFAGLDHLAEVE